MTPIIFGKIVFGKSLLQRASLALLATSLGACGGDDGSGDDSALPGAVVDQPQVEPSNQPPEVSGTPAATATVGQAYSFTPDATDADKNDFLEFSITNKPAWATFSDETGALTGTPAAAHVGESEEITIIVTDGKETRAIGPFTIVVNSVSAPPPSPSNGAPTITGTPPGSVIVDQQYRFQPTYADPDGDRLRYSISNRPAWATFSTASGVLIGTPRPGNVGTYSNIVISVNDGSVTTSTARFAIQVQGPLNTAPSITGSPTTTVQATQAYSFQPAGSDPDSDTLTYSIVNRPTWATFNTTTGRLSGTPAAANVGTYSNIVITVSDGRASAALNAFSIVVSAPANRAPTITGSPATSVTAGSSYSFTPSAADGDRDTLGFTIRNLPSWAAFDTATGRLSGTPAATVSGTFANIVISVSDGRLSASLPAFTVRVNEPDNHTPTIRGTPGTSVTAGTAYSFQPTGADADGDTLTYSIQNMPSWANFNTSNGRLSGTPGTGNAGSFSNIIISVSDGDNTASLPSFGITVSQAAANGSAVLSWTPPTQNTDGSSLSNLAGYRIVYGTSSTNLSRTIEITNVGQPTYTVTGLAAGTWYFAVRAYNSAGAESAASNVGSKTIR